MKVNKPNYTAEFKEAVHKATAKGATSVIVDETNYLYVIVKAQNGRKLGTFYFEKDDDKAILTKKHITEKEYKPLEFAVASLIKYCKNKKIKHILLNNEPVEHEQEDFS